MSYNLPLTSVAVDASIRVQDFPPFHQAEVDFSSRLTYLIGCNGSGKSTLLRLLSTSGGGRHWMWHTDPDKTRRRVGTVTWRDEVMEIELRPGPHGVRQPVTHRKREAPFALMPSYLIPPRHRKGLASPLTDTWNSRNEVRRFRGALHQQESRSVDSAIDVLTGQLILLSSIHEDTFDAFRNIVINLTEGEFSLRELQIQEDGVWLRYSHGDCPIAFASDGMQWTICIAWLAFLLENSFREGLIAIDEPENHLHPRMQRLLIPRLLKAFPALNFVVSTHSPMILNGDEDARTYVLKWGLRGIESVPANEGKGIRSADEVLRTTMDVDAPYPAWVEERLERAYTQARRSDGTIDLEAAYEAVQDAGLGEWTGARWLKLLGERL